MKLVKPNQQQVIAVADLEPTISFLTIFVDIWQDWEEVVEHEAMSSTSNTSLASISK